MTWNVTVSPGFASAGLTEVVSVTSLGLARVELSFWAGLGGSSAPIAAGRGSGKEHQGRQPEPREQNRKVIS